MRRRIVVPAILVAVPLPACAGRYPASRHAVAHDAAVDRGCLALRYGDSLPPVLPRTVRLSGWRGPRERGGPWYAAYEREGVVYTDDGGPWTGRWRPLGADSALVEWFPGVREERVAARMTLLVRAGTDTAGTVEVRDAPARVVAVRGSASFACYPYRL